MLASDRLSFTTKVNSVSLDRSGTRAIILDTKKLVSKSLTFTFMHINRACNGVAHALAKSAIPGASWVIDVPDMVQSIIFDAHHMMNQ